MQIFDDKTVDLDLNGPILSFTTNPTGVGSTGVGINSTGGGSVELTGIATATFPTTADNAGFITYRWYEQGVGALSDSTYVTGTATTTLTLSNLITPSDNQRKFYLEADYVPSYYTTGNAPNEPLNSGLGTVTVDPLIEIVSQPTSQTTIINNTPNQYQTGQVLSLIVEADLSDSYFADDLIYQWFIDGEAATDEVRERITTTSSTVVGTVENTYTSRTEVTVPSTATNIEVVLAGAQGGNGGRDGNGPGGVGAQGRAGRFTMPDGSKLLEFFIGKRGDGGRSGSNPSTGGAGGDLEVGPGINGNGGEGGGAGPQGWSGGGGGGGAGSYLTNNGNVIIISAGGGGGGGGSHNRGGDSGFSRNPGVGLGYGQGTIGNIQRGGDGQDKSGDGGGGGGGGSGNPAGSGGGSGQDNSHGGEAGGGGASAQDPSQVTRVGGGWLHEGNGYGYLKYTGYTSNSVTTTRKTTISGSNTNTLRLACDTVGVQTAQCKISSASASNSYMMTDEVNAVFVSTAADNLIKIESIGVTDTASLTDINLSNGDYTFEVEGVDADNNGINQFYSFYSPDKDMEVEMDLYGGKGTDFSVWAAGMGWGTGFEGGEGGYSRIRFTISRNTEYVIAGLINSVNAPFLYKKAQLIACVGQGGQGGHYGRGGFGGGVDVAGEDGQSRLAGSGGELVSAGNLGGNGRFGGSYVFPQGLNSNAMTFPNVPYPGDSQGSSAEGGQTITCTKGVFWRNQGRGACEDVRAGGNTKFDLWDGTGVSNTTDSITRGFKAGYNIMQTASNRAGDGGGGGNGATGGNGAASGGGGGGSGFAQNCTVVSTQLGGSTGNAKVVLRVVS